MLTITDDSHTDHALTPAHLAWIVERYADRNAFFLETILLPESLAPLPCALRGPLVGDAPIQGGIMLARGDRKYPSRLLFDPTVRTTRQLSVIAGPHSNAKGSWSCLLYTAFGGPVTPKEPNDPTLTDEKRAESVKFWSEHALAVPELFVHGVMVPS